MLKKIIQPVIDLFFPIICFGCDTILLTNETLLCTSCRHNIPVTNHCFQPDNEMYRRFYGRVAVEFVGSKFFFLKKGIVQKLIYNLKYYGHQEIGTFIGNWFADDLKNVAIIKTVDEIIPVPLHTKRLKTRGYNQVESFGLSLSKNLNINYNPDLLVRKIYSESQTKKVFEDRTEANLSVFDVVFDEKDNNKHYMIIDDVFTTGATLEMCSRALLKIPGAKISIVCMSMAH